MQGVHLVHSPPTHWSFFMTCLFQAPDVLGAHLSLLQLCNAPSAIHTPHVPYPFICGWMLALLLCHGCCMCATTLHDQLSALRVTVHSPEVGL